MTKRTKIQRRFRKKNTRRRRTRGGESKQKLTYQGYVYGNNKFNFYSYSPSSNQWYTEIFTIIDPNDTQHLKRIKERAEKLFDNSGKRIVMEEGLSIDAWLSKNGYPHRPDASIAPITPTLTPKH